MAVRLLSEGFVVFGSVRSDAKATELRAQLGDNFFPLLIDICNPSQIADARKDVEQVLDGRRLFAIINNAGSAEIGPLLHVDPDQFKHQLDTLVVGQLRVIQAFWQLLISPSSNPGRIYNISSISGVGVNQFFGCYASAKHALEGMSKTLRLELKMYGIKIIVIAPGNIATKIWPKQTKHLIDQYRNTDYFHQLAIQVNIINSETPKGAMSVEQFTEEFFKIFSELNPADRYTIVKSRRWNWPRPFNRLLKPKVMVKRS